MDIFLPNSAFLGNIEGFIKKYDATSSDSLNISFHTKSVSIHPVVLAMTACAGLTYKQKGKKINVDINSVINTKSLPYIIRMGLFDILDLDIDFEVTKHEASGKLIPLSQIQSSDDLNKFITSMIPLLHANPREAEPIKYVIGECGICHLLNKLLRIPVASLVYRGKGGLSHTNRNSPHLAGYDHRLSCRTYRHDDNELGSERYPYLLPALINIPSVL